MDWTKKSAEFENLILHVRDENLGMLALAAVRGEQPNTFYNREVGKAFCFSADFKMRNFIDSFNALKTGRVASRRIHCQEVKREKENTVAGKTGRMIKLIQVFCKKDKLTISKRYNNIIQSTKLRSLEFHT